MIGGIQYSNSLTSWVAYKPTDSLNNIAASFHSYNFNLCVDQTCWDATVGAVLTAGYPVITGEIGQNDCGSWYIDKLMTWFDARNVSYLAWTWVRRAFSASVKYD